MGIEMVNEKLEKKHDGGLRDASCTACEMAVIWIQNQLKHNKTEDQILNYVNEVNDCPFLIINMWIKNNALQQDNHAFKTFFIAAL